MPTYIVDLWLSCNRNETPVLEAFDLRFPRSLERSWKDMVVEADDQPHLAERLNEKIFAACGTDMRQDLNEQVGDVFDPGTTFSNTPWEPGTGGQHEGHLVPAKAQVTRNGGRPADEVWTFRVNAMQAVVQAHVRFAVR